MTGGALTLNGVQIVKPGQLTKRVEFLTRIVRNLSAEDNRLTATLTGPPDAEVTVTIEDRRR